jgi:hypothetical protein
MNREVQKSESSVKDLNFAVGFGDVDHASYRHVVMDIKQDTQFFK